MLTPPRAQLRFLGGFRAEMEAAPTQALRITARKGRALLAYLATRPDWRDSRERLANLLWGDRVDTQARHNLRQCLVVLRRDLQPVGAEALTIEGEEVALNRDLFSDRLAGGIVGCGRPGTCG